MDLFLCFCREFLVLLVVFLYRYWFFVDGIFGTTVGLRFRVVERFLFWGFEVIVIVIIVRVVMLLICVCSSLSGL